MSHQQPPPGAAFPPAGQPSGGAGMPPHFFPPRPGGPPVGPQIPTDPARATGDRARSRRGLMSVVAAMAVMALVAVGSMVYGLVLRTDEDVAVPTAGTGDNTIAIEYEELADLLKAHSKALKEGDKEAYLAPFVGEELKEDQLNLFNNLQEIPFSRASYSVSSMTGRGTDNYGQGASLVVDVNFKHQIENVDKAQVAEKYSWTVEKASQDGDLKVTSVSGSRRGEGTEMIVYYPAPWDLYDDMLTIRKKNVLILADQEDAAQARRIAPLVEQAAKDNLAAWDEAGPEPTPAMPGYLVVLEDDRKTYERLYRKKKTDGISEGGVTYSLPSHDSEAASNDINVGGARIVVDTGGARFQGADWRAGALDISRHEIAHAMVAHTAGHIIEGDAQSWVSEGFADYMALRDKEELAARSVAAMERSLNAGLGFDGQLPPTGRSFYSSVSPNPNYTLGYLAIRFIVEKSGEAAAFTFVTEQYKHPEQLDRQLRKATGMGTAEFEAAWADYVRKEMR